MTYDPLRVCLVLSFSMKYSLISSETKTYIKYIYCLPLGIPDYVEIQIRTYILLHKLTYTTLMLLVVEIAIKGLIPPNQLGLSPQCFKKRDHHPMAHERTICFFCQKGIIVASKKPLYLKTIKSGWKCSLLTLHRAPQKKRTKNLISYMSVTTRQLLLARVASFSTVLLQNFAIDSKAQIALTLFTCVHLHTNIQLCLYFEPELYIHICL